MKLIIDIPDGYDLTRIQNGSIASKVVLNAVKNGTPLPKGQGKFKDRKEQRKVTETMNALLLPLLPCLSSETAIVVKRALYLLGEIEVGPQESEVKE